MIGTGNATAAAMLDGNGVASFAGAFYLCDENRYLYFYESPFIEPVQLGQLPYELTDIALSPSGRLYGITANSLYELDLVTKSLELIGDHGLFDANAFDIDEYGDAFIASGTESGIYLMDLETSEATYYGGSGFASAGDLVATLEGFLVSTQAGQIVQLDYFGDLVATANHDLDEVFGLSLSDDGLLAFDGSSVYELGAGGSGLDFVANLAVDGVVGIEGAAGTWAYDTGPRLSEDAAQTVAYLYEAALDRNGDIDLPGLNFWLDIRQGGASEREVAGYFLDSDEFAQLIGDPDTLSDRELVEELYFNVLDRPGEQAGVDFWTGIVGRPDFDRIDLLLAFAESDENREGSPFVEDLAEVLPSFWDFA